MVLKRQILSSAMALVVFCAPVSVLAAGDIDLRGSERKESTRLVFDAGRPVPYRVEGGGASYRIIFTDPTLDVAIPQEIENLARVKTITKAGPRSVTLDIGQGQKLNHFLVGHKVVIDIKGPAGTPPKKNTVSQETEKTDRPANLAAAMEPAADKPVSKGAGGAHSSQIKVDIATKGGDGEGGQAPAKVTEKSKISEPPTVISISSTAPVPMAVFRRRGYLWVVQDRENVSIPPGVEHAEEPHMERVPATGVAVFRMRWPDTKKIYVTGGGLVWKISSQFEGAVEPQSNIPKPEFGVEKAAGPAIFWPATSVHRLTDFIDPDTGDRLHIAFVTDAKDFAGDEKRYVEVDFLPSYAGLITLPKTDDLVFEKKKDGVSIVRPEGMAISPPKDIVTSKPAAANILKTSEAEEKTVSATEPEPVANDVRVFDFAKWRIGDKKNIAESQRVVMSGLGEQTDLKRAENLIALGNMMLSFGYAHEAQGYFSFAVQTLPAIETSPEFMASRAAALALAGHSKDAFSTFLSPQFHGMDEIKLWKAMALADLDDWAQAAEQVKTYLPFWENYPDEIRFPLGLAYAEIMLREGLPDKGGEILDKLAEGGESKMDFPRRSAWAYLRGEYSRQKNDLDDAKERWQELSEGADDLYRAKARFALTTLKLDTKDITLDKAIDNLEGLRYAWRGDSLETAINYKLAKLYLEKEEPIKALTMMRLAHALSPESEIGKKIDADMRATYKNLFDPAKIKALSPIDAATLYSEFSDLAPAGAEGDALSRQLAERLVDADLLPRAEKLLQTQIDSKLQGVEGADVAMRLASLQLLDDKGDEALKTLTKASEFLKDLPADQVGMRDHDIEMLKAKALSLMGKPQEAIEKLNLLPQEDDVLKLRADIAWRAKKWQDAADALEQYLLQQDISLTRPLTDAQAETILNWAVALYLADNRYVLANVRERYSEAMMQTPFSKKFDVITRPRQNAFMADKETVRAIIDETAIFKDFLAVFKKGETLAAKGTGGVEAAPLSRQSLQNQQIPAQNIPEELKNAPLLKTDAVSTD